MALDARSHALERAAEPGLHISRQIEIHQTIGGANLDLRIGVVGSLDQWIETARGPDFGDLFRRFEAYVAVLVL